MTIKEFLEKKAREFQLELLTDEGTLDREITTPEMVSPGLVLAGYTERFSADRLQVLGETELSFLQMLDVEAQRRAIEDFLSFDIPAVFVTKGQVVPTALVEEAQKQGIPLIRTGLKTGEFYQQMHTFLEAQFAPTTTVHGSLADVYGVGLLIVGKSGIGKSECVLDLVERGHRLVADDLVHITRRGREVLIGKAGELQGHFMEIRGVGIIDVQALFGIRAVRLQKRIEVVVHLVQWQDDVAYDRLGLDEDRHEILGVTLPEVTIPLNPGKNITVIAEVVAMNHLQKYAGYHPARLFNQRLVEHLRTKAQAEVYLEEDYE